MSTLYEFVLPAAPSPTDADAERSLAHVLPLLERLCYVLATSAAVAWAAAATDFEAAICGLIPPLQATGATEQEAVACLIRAVRCATGHRVPVRVTATRTAVVIGCCERAYVPDAGPHPR